VPTQQVPLLPEAGATSVVPLLRHLLDLPGLRGGQVRQLVVRLPSRTITAYLLLYVDDIVLTALSPELLQRSTTALHKQFVMKDLGPRHHFLGVLVEQQSDDLFLHQHQYA
jgi:hypothetical protein